MKPIDYVIIAVIVIALTFSVLKIIRNKKKGKTSCGCDCANCKGCSIKSERSEK